MISNSFQNNADYVKHNANFYNSVAASFSDISKISPEQYAYQKIERDKFVSLVKSGKVLDAGCGSGLQTGLLAQYSSLVLTGVDISSSQLNNARAICPNVTFSQMDLRKLHFEPESFDGIWANASLIHISPEDLPHTLKQFHNILKPNGYFYASFKQSEPPKSINKSHSITYYYELENIKKYFKDASFNIIDGYTYREDERVNRGRGVEWIVVFAEKN